MKMEIFSYFTNHSVQDIKVENNIHKHGEVLFSETAMKCLLASILSLSVLSQ